MPVRRAASGLVPRRHPRSSRRIVVATGLVVTAVSTSARAEVWVTEVHADAVGSEPALEWVEIANLEPDDANLAVLRLSDEETPHGTEGVLAFPDGATLEPWGVAVIANDGAAFLSTWGFRPDFEETDTDPLVANLVRDAALGGARIQLANAADELLLLDMTGHVLDGVTWGGAVALDGIVDVAAPREGQSIARSLSADTGPRPWGIEAPTPGVVVIDDIPPPDPAATSSGEPTQQEPPPPDPTADPTQQPPAPTPEPPAPTSDDPSDEPSDDDTREAPAPIPGDDDSGVGLGDGRAPAPFVGVEAQGCSSTTMPTSALWIAGAALLRRRRARR